MSGCEGGTYVPQWVVSVGVVGAISGFVERYGSVVGASIWIREEIDPQEWKPLTGGERIDPWELKWGTTGGGQ